MRTRYTVLGARGLLILGAAVLLWALEPMTAAACETCFGAKVDTPATRGIALAMLMLVGMTGVVWGGIGAFFLHLRRRARMLEPGDLVVTEDGEIRSPRGEID